MRRDDLLDLNDVLQHPGRRIAVEVATDLESEEDLDLVEPLEGELEAVSTGNLLLITGQFKTKCVLECARCTAPIECPVEFEVDEQFPVEGTPSMLNPQDSAKVAVEEDFPLFEGNQLMVEALLRQDLLISLPVQALCRHGWDGECPHAKERGVDLEKAHGHPELQHLAEKLKGKLPEGDA